MSAGSWSVVLWGGFVALVLLILFVDLFIFARKRERIATGKALLMTGIFMLMGIAFGGVIYVVYDHQLLGALGKANDGSAMTGRTALIEYFTVWVLEYMMSVDNLFVFTLIFAHFAVPDRYQHRVLFWGILGAIVFRGLMIGVGTELVHLFEPALIVFGLVLLWTAVKMLKSDDEHFDPSRSIALRVARFFFPVSEKMHGDRFFVRHGMDAVWDNGHLGSRALRTGAWVATPLFLVLCVVEATDVLFAVDSVPAALGQSKERYIIFTANVFAILGLRSLYFAISSLMRAFTYLKVSLAVILIFVGLKMVISPELRFVPIPAGVANLFGMLDTSVNPPVALGHWKGVHLPTWVSLTVIGLCLLAGVVGSLVVRPRGKSGKTVHHKGTEAQR